MKKNKPTVDTNIILESISDGVFTVDKEWRISSFNRAAERITGVDKQEALGRYCSEVFRSSLCGDQCALRETLTTGKVLIDKACYFINSEGDKIPVTLSTAILKDEQGNIIGGAETFRDVSELEALKERLITKNKSGLLTSRSTIMLNVISVIETVAETSVTVLLNGETGTGKEVTAKAIHRLSPRSALPFLALNCAALPESLLESTLFGHVKGAFTGALENKLGYFSRAGAGTLFLDEIGDISAAMQMRLLRVLQEREFEPVGGHRIEKTKARIIVATNKDLLSLVKKGLFREDLYYRLNVIRIELPSLKQRAEDIPFLVDQFIAHFNKEHMRNIKGISADALLQLQQYAWPGNIRELENSIERACILSKNSAISATCFPFLNSEITAPLCVKETPDLKLNCGRDDVEKQIIINALNQNKSKVDTAKQLGVHKTTLFRKMKKYNIEF